MVGTQDASAAAASAATTAASPAEAMDPKASATDSRKHGRSASRSEATDAAASSLVESAVGADISAAADDAAAAAVVAADAAAAGAAAHGGEDDDGFTEDENEAMSEVMAKMKEVADSTAAAFSAAGAQAVDVQQASVARNGVAVPTNAVAGAEAVNGANGRVQLYDSKRMSRVSFNSWFEFDSYFEMYMQDTFQPFRMRSSCSVEAYRRNQQKVMMNNKNSRGRRIEFPDEAIHHHRIYMCTHAMKARCRGATTRPGQKYRGIGCIAKINVKISPSDNPSKYMVIVTDQVVTHNHPISREIYESYPDVLMKTMRRNQLNASLLTRQPTPKFETPAQSEKYERAVSVLSFVAEAMARLSDEDYEAQLAQLQKIYGGVIAGQNTRTV